MKVRAGRKVLPLRLFACAAGTETLLERRRCRSGSSIGGELGGSLVAKRAVWSVMVAILSPSGRKLWPTPRNWLIARPGSHRARRMLCPPKNAGPRRKVRALRAPQRDLSDMTAAKGIKDPGLAEKMGNNKNPLPASRRGGGRVARLGRCKPESVSGFAPYGKCRFDLPVSVFRSTNKSEIP
jgi:hypothetical protein